MTTIEIELPDATAKAARDAGLLTPQALDRLLTDAIRRRQAADALLSVADRVAEAGIAPMPTMASSDAEALQTSYHEAGHAVLALASGFTVHSCSINPGGGWEGRTHYRNPLPHLQSDSPKLRDYSEKVIRICFGGECAERRWFSIVQKDRFLHDRCEIFRVLEKLSTSKRIKKAIMCVLRMEAEVIIEKNAQLIYKIVEELHEVKLLRKGRLQALWSDYGAKK